MALERLDHIAFRVSEVKPVVDFYVNTLGFRVVQEMEMDLGGSKAYSNVLNLPGVPFYIFVDQGMDEENIITKWVDKFGSRLHHMAYLVKDIQTASEVLRQKGMVFTTDEVIDTGGGLKQLFTTPHPITGVITEIIQRYKDDVFFVQENVIQLIKSTEEFNK
jgi:catechol 2,3-dioxygenase-like lactoylglutathione lyase family enzyme